MQNLNQPKWAQYITTTNPGKQTISTILFIYFFFRFFANGIKFLHHNVNGLTSKIKALIINALGSDYDVILCTESHISFVPDPLSSATFRATVAQLKSKYFVLNIHRAINTRRNGVTALVRRYKFISVRRVSPDTFQQLREDHVHEALDTLFFSSRPPNARF